jgi:hypothetical protein
VRNLREAKDGVAVGLDESFVRNRAGEAVANSFGGQIDFTDMHPNCRCNMNLMRIDQVAEHRGRVISLRPAVKLQSHRS